MRGGRLHQPTAPQATCHPLAGDETFDTAHLGAGLVAPQSDGGGLFFSTAAGRKLLLFPAVHPARLPLHAGVGRCVCVAIPLSQPSVPACRRSTGLYGKDFSSHAEIAPL